MHAIDTAVCPEVQHKHPPFQLPAENVKIGRLLLPDIIILGNGHKSKICPEHGMLSSLAGVMGRYLPPKSERCRVEPT